MINSHSIFLMIDPLLRDFDLPVMIDFPIKAIDVQKLDAVLISHSENDQHNISTNRDLKGVTKAFHSIKYVDSLMKAEGFASFGHLGQARFHPYMQLIFSNIELKRYCTSQVFRLGYGDVAIA